MAKSPKHFNRLAHEKSPYLLQHAHNPVDWFAWSDEAFELAARENKPIFLSIGYSTCHWCHVMERESFENERIAAYLNKHFVSVKVDREERPDVDKIYMMFVQASTGGGGWPLSAFLTPDLKPFFGGTYFPPDSRHGRPGFLQVLEHVAELWRKRRSDIAESAEGIHSQLETAAKTSATPHGSRPALDAGILENAATLFKSAYDSRNGGFGGAPKFPQPSTPQLLLRCAKRFQDREAAQMVLHTCERMAAGGIHDQLGGGFARYAVDAEWLVPHFEKMLYDNAQLAQLYLDASLVAKEINNTGEAETFSNVVHDILNYVLRDMTHSGGGFFSAEDADSEGHEGKFYCWTHEELSELLPPDEFKVAAKYFGVTTEGNFVDHSHPEPLRGQNVLSIAHPFGKDAGAQKLLANAKHAMFAARAKRVRPHRDDKILTSWNGLMLGAFARASAILNDPHYLNAAEQDLRFIREHLWVAGDDKSGPSLFHRWRDGKSDTVQLLEDHAFLLLGVIELYECTLEPAHLDFAIELAGAMLKKFFDSKNGGFWQSAAGSKNLILSLKDDYDGAEPSGNSAAALSLLKLAAITGQKDFAGAAEKTLGLFAGRLQKIPQAVPFLLQALDFSLQEPARVVIAGRRDSKKFQELLRAAHSVYQPNKIVIGNTGPVDDFSRTLPAKGDATVYICHGNTCQPPMDDAISLVKTLKC
ncbi:MAG TPA: thioredoxin domain-containing protein [Candidatus Sulfotelmatobacter sp.]|nr:thioredoxin domain-containing protein [Candidatus Sulfotelmatobacter sp.]